MGPRSQRGLTVPGRAPVRATSGCPGSRAARRLPQIAWPALSTSPIEPGLFDERRVQAQRPPLIMPLMGEFPGGTLEWSGGGRGEAVVMTGRAASAS